MRINLRTALFVMLLPGLFFALAAPTATAQGPAGLIADRPSFAAGSPALFRGRGFAPGERVTFQIAHVRGGTPATGPNQAPMMAVADPNGGFVATWVVCSTDCVGELLQIEATGQTSARTARAVFHVTPVARGTRVGTDRADYAPGTTAHVSGAGFQAGEAVTLQVVHADGTPDHGADHAPWVVFAGTDGALATTWHVCEDDCLHSTLKLTAVGQASGWTAQAIFTDAVGSPTFESIKSFGTAATGGYPIAELMQATNGLLYGTSSGGGTSYVGTLFKVNPDGTGFTLLRNFDYSSGAYPSYGPLIQGTDGALYGTTYYGGSGSYGTVYKVNLDGSGFTVLKNFDYSTTGGYVFAGVIQGADGALYGTTYFGGSNGVGTVYKLNTDGTGFAVIHEFDYTTGAYTYAGLVQGSDGALYGASPYGGSIGSGTLFKLNTDGTGFTVLQDLDGSTAGGSPYAGLIRGTDGTLYGSTNYGGSSGGGTVFKLNADGTGFTVIQNLDYFTTGSNPWGELTLGTDGLLYGTALSGGANYYGTAFKLNTDGTGFTVLKNFDYSGGGSPYAGLIQGTDGALYGPAYQGGGNGAGTVYKLATDGSGFTVLKDLIYAPTMGTEGADPFATVRQGADGALYGTTYVGGSFGAGTLYKLNLDGTGFTVLKNFDYSTSGGYPQCQLTQGTDGALYGTAYVGGSNGYGTAFKLNTDGTGFTVLKNFDRFTSGGYPFGGVIQGSDGALYGTCNAGGSSDYGTLFKLNADGSGFTVLHHFDYYTTGAYPYATPIQGADGALYGTAYYAGPMGSGNVYRVNTDGTGFTVLHDFDNSATGGYPFAGVMQAADGALYGSASNGGTFGYGTLFKLNTNGTGFTVIQDFDGTTGGYPYNRLVQRADGGLYGTTYYGGSGTLGVAFGINPDGSDFTVLQNFDGGAVGSYPYGGLASATDGNLYGTTYQSGAAGFGTVYRLVFEGANQPPVARCKDVTVAAGASCTAAASIDDGSSDPDAGDSITLTQSPAGPYAIGNTLVTLTVTDSHGASDTCAATVTVTNPAPAAIITGPVSGSVFPVNTAVAFTGTWTDANGGAHTAQWTFDGVPDASFSAGSGASGSANTSHTFSAAGVYLVQLAVTDACGASGGASQVGGVDAMVVVFDPNAGFVTGGGWINSPAGAWTADPSLTGKANFGFVSKYKKGASTPTGETEFQYKVGNLNFHSTSYDWLVVAGAKAQYKGTGTINNAGTYKFILTSIDGQISGGGGADKFRMKITTTGGGLVYDNLLNAPDSDDPTTLLGGGSIVIHTGGNSASAEAGSPLAESALPVEYALAQNFPNPFDRSTVIGFSLPERSSIRIAVYDLAGREVRRLADGAWEAGRHSATLARTDAAGRLGSGIYFVRMSARSLTSDRTFSSLRKLVLVD